MFKCNHCLSVAETLRAGLQTPFRLGAIGQDASPFNYPEKDL